MERLIPFTAIAVTAFLFVIPAWAQSVSAVTLTNGPPSASNSGARFPFALTGAPARGQVVAAVTLVNGPPNIPNASPCTTASCAWMPSNAPSGSHVSLVFADLTPIKNDFTGSFTLSDQAGHSGDSSHFSISTSAQSYLYPLDGTTHNRNVGEIKTSGTLAAQDYFIVVTASGASGSNTQNVTVHSASCNSTISPGAGSIPTSGTVCLGAGTYNPNAAGGSQVSNLTGILLGIGNGATIVDGNNAACGGVNQNASQAGGAVIGIQFQNYKCLPAPQGYPILTYVNTVVRNNRVINSAGSGILIQGAGSFVANNVVDNMGYGAIGANLLATSTQTTNVIGNELSHTNPTGYDTCNDAGTIKYLPVIGGTINFTNNYFHDNTGGGPWPDTSNIVSNISGNTFVRQSPNGPSIEQSPSGTTIDHNVFAHIGDGSHFAALYCDSDAPPGQPPPYCGGGHCVYPSGDPGPSAAVTISGSANVNVHDNNISVYSVSHPGKAYDVNDALGNGTDCTYKIPDISNNTPHDNTVNFFTTDPGATWAFDQIGCDANPGTTNTAGTASTSNQFHLIGGNTSTDAHWYWFNQGNTAQTIANYRSSGQDANSTIDTTDTSTTGCTHVACSGSGIGAGGVPLMGPGGLSIQSMALANSTFTPNVAKGAVGTVSVTMSDGSAFSGKLSITGTNSGGFQLSGNTLEEKASGTPAGTYHDFNVVAAQSTASNSPQQISPTVTGVVEAPFGGTARLMTNRIQAEDFDVGGYSVAYRATDVCGIGIDTAYGTDRLNVYPTADLDGESNLKIGCNQAGDWHNYTITAATASEVIAEPRNWSISRRSKSSLSASLPASPARSAIPALSDPPQDTEF